MTAINYINSISSSAVANASESKFQNTLTVAQNSVGQELTAEKLAKNKGAADEFEALFIGQLVRMMFETVEVDEVFGGGYAEETYRSMMVDEYGEIMSQAGGIGVSENVLRKLNALSEAQ